MGIDFHIDELVLHGFAPRDRHRIAEAMQLELARLITASSQTNLLKDPASLERMSAGAIEIKAGAKPQATGIQIARAVFRSLRQQAKPTVGAPTARSITGGSNS